MAKFSLLAVLMLVVRLAVAQSGSAPAPAPETLFNQARAQTAAGKLDDAVETYRTLIAANSNDMQKSALWGLIAQIRHAQHNLPAARDAMLEALKLSPGNAALLTNIGMVYGE